MNIKIFFTEHLSEKIIIVKKHFTWPEKVTENYRGRQIRH